MDAPVPAQPDASTAPPPPPASGAAPDTAPPSTPDVRGLIDQSRKMGATDDQIRDLMVKAPFLQETWQASEKAGIPPNTVFQHFGLSVPDATAMAGSDAPDRGGIARNIGAGMTDAGAGIVNVLSDPVGNLIGKPLAIAGTFAHDALAPLLGYDRFTPEQRATMLDDTVPQPGTRLVSAIGDAVGADPSKVAANTQAEQYARIGTAGAAGAAAFMGPAALIPGAAGAVVGQVAGQAAPDWAKPAAELAGNVLGFGVGAGGVVGASRGADMVNRFGSGIPRPDPAAAVAAIGAAPDVDGAIAAAGKAAATPSIDLSGSFDDQITRLDAEARAGGYESAADKLAQEGGLAPEMQSVGAAATDDLDPGMGKLTPAQELAYRSTAEGQKLLEPQPVGISDNTEYVPGVVPNESETTQTAAASRELKTLKILNPDIAEESANVTAANGDARQRHFQQLAGSDVDIANDVAVRNARMDAETKTAWANKEDADIQPVIDAANEILQSRDGRRPLVRGVISSVLKELYDKDGNPITDPEILYGVGDHINDLLDQNDAGGQKKNARASSSLMALKNALYDDVIEPAAPGFQQALDNYHQASIRIDEMAALQKFEPKLYDANNRMTYAKVQTMMRQIVDSRQAPGLNPFKSISDDTMAGLWDLRDDLRRTASAENLARTPGGSDTTQNMFDAAKMAAKGAGSTILHAIPVVGDAIKRGMDVAQPLLDAREARARSARGMEMLHPAAPPIEQQDQPSIPTPARRQIEREQALMAAMKARTTQGQTNAVPR